MQEPVAAAGVPPRATKSVYPEPFAARMAGRTKRVLGDRFGLSNFGVNLATLEPGAVSALQHRHGSQDEFVYVLQGEVTLVRGSRTNILGAGMCIGFPAGGESHHLENRSDAIATYLEVGDRTEGDMVEYPSDDLVAVREGGAWRFTHKDGTSYDDGR
ncbi:MAG TPA: cupin domain-containing protein [Allosphingosinicella sp.]|jgi:uncharacterized cupin superfamily protein